MNVRPAEVPGWPRAGGHHCLPGLIARRACGRGFGDRPAAGSGEAGRPGERVMAGVDPAQVQPATVLGGTELRGEPTPSAVLTALQGPGAWDPSSALGGSTAPAGQQGMGQATQGFQNPDQAAAAAAAQQLQQQLRHTQDALKGHFAGQAAGQARFPDRLDPSAGAAVVSQEGVQAAMLREQAAALLTGYGTCPPDSAEALAPQPLPTALQELQELMHRRLSAEPQVAHMVHSAAPPAAAPQLVTMPGFAEYPAAPASGQYQVGYAPVGQWPPQQLPQQLPQPQAGAPGGMELAAWQLAQLQQRAGAPPPAQLEGQAAANAHSFTCEICGITCCGRANFEQHRACKKHLRKAALAASTGCAPGGSAGPGPTYELGSGPEPERDRATTYVGLQAQCRAYCKQVISTELNWATSELLQQLLLWQERAKSANPMQASSHKRVVSGLREVDKAVRSRKACSVVMAPNIEQDEDEGRLDGLLAKLLGQAKEYGIPVVYALSRKKLGQAFGCPKKMSAIAILDYRGAEELYARVEALAAQGRAAHRLYNAGLTGVPGAPSLGLLPQGALLGGRRGGAAPAAGSQYAQPHSMKLGQAWSTDALAAAGRFLLETLR
ncbi:hypothetical protein WJX81_007203 [Elliptochloris bilobata]|uniref:C2H2-type domain-containing protein n=1 Tax=Elliptochloris bilobata TaxID=381761 RepID=A0AAW1RGW2_9CHLO